jgi:hypothetical protein
MRPGLRAYMLAGATFRPVHASDEAHPNASAAMTRLLLATFLLLCASTALAKSPASTQDPADGSAKPGKGLSSGPDSDSVAPAHPVSPPARSSTIVPLPTRGGAPRWHSLLPGMIR